MKLETCRVDTDVRSSHVVPCVVLTAVSPGTVFFHRHEGAAISAGTLDRQLTFSSPAAYSCDFQPAQSVTRLSWARIQGDSHVALSLRGLRIRHRAARAASRGGRRLRRTTGI